MKHKGMGTRMGAGEPVDRPPQYLNAGYYIRRLLSQKPTSWLRFSLPTEDVTEIQDEDYCSGML